MMSQDISIDEYITKSNRDNCNLFSELSSIEKPFYIDIWEKQKLGRKNTFVIIARNLDLSELFHRTIFLDNELLTLKEKIILNPIQRELDQLINWSGGDSDDDKFYFERVALKKKYNETYENIRGMTHDEQINIMLKCIQAFGKLKLKSIDGNISRYLLNKD